MDNQLSQKTKQYHDLLAEACRVVDVADQNQHEQLEGGRDCIEMAESYLRDGEHFEEQDDRINALAAYSYGHGWLDAGVRIGVLTAPPDTDNIFTM